jgi:hypothetical protein
MTQLKTLKTRANTFFGLAIAMMTLLAAPVLNVSATDNRAPETAASLVVPAGNRVHFHANAIGVQIYVCTQSATDPTKFSWVFKAPEAVLLDNDGNIVGIHYGGPTWESNSGSLVVGARLAGATVDPTAIPWLLLAGVRSEGPGIFDGTTFIQRVNTVGGLAPTTGADAAHVGQEVRVGYTAEYYFYREEN